MEWARWKAAGKEGRFVEREGKMRYRQFTPQCNPC